MCHVGGSGSSAVLNSFHVSFSLSSLNGATSQLALSYVILRDPFPFDVKQLAMRCYEMLRCNYGALNLWRFC